MSGERCGCPGDWAVVSPTGCCDRCGYEGTKRAEAIKSALASGRHQLATELGRQEGLLAGYRIGHERGKAELQANAEADQEYHDPFRREPEYDELELEAG